jgi:putative copper export protein
VLHTLAGAAWSGGLLALVTALGHRHRSGIALRAGAMVSQFSSIATFGVVTAAAAGIALAATRLDAVADLWATRYGLALSAKTAVVVVVAGIGAYNHLALVPRVARAHDPSAERRLRRLGMIEVVLIAAVLGITAALVGLAG